MLIAAIPLSLLYGRALYESERALAEGDGLATRDPAGAVLAWRHAVEWYAPGNPWSREAAGRLAAIGLGAIESPADLSHALLALESLRSAILVARSLYTPYGARLDPVEQRIAELRGAESAERTGQPLEGEVARQLALLRESRGRAPAPGWSLLTTLAFLAWIAVTWRGLRLGYDDNGRLKRVRALSYAAASLVALATWIVGLTLV